MNLFFTPPDRVGEKELLIEGQESSHLVKVLRHRQGDLVQVTDGSGNLFQGSIISARSDSTRVTILSRETKQKRSPSITMCIGMIRKRDRLEYAVEKVTEIGADRIYLFHGDHSEKAGLRIDRLESAALSAMKQSLSCWLPVISHFQNLKQAVEQGDETAVLIVADETISGFDGCYSVTQSENFTLVVGPEGGLSEAERNYLKSRDAGFISLGANRLRTETAAAVMCDRFRNRC